MAPAKGPMKNQAMPLPAIAMATDELVPPRSKATIGRTVKFIEKAMKAITVSIQCSRNVPMPKASKVCPMPARIMFRDRMLWSTFTSDVGVNSVSE